MELPGEVRKFSGCGNRSRQCELAPGALEVPGFDESLSQPDSDSCLELSGSARNSLQGGQEMCLRGSEVFHSQGKITELAQDIDSSDHFGWGLVAAPGCGVFVMSLERQTEEPAGVPVPAELLQDCAQVLQRHHNELFLAQPAPQCQCRSVFLQARLTLVQHEVSLAQVLVRIRFPRIQSILSGDLLHPVQACEGIVVLLLLVVDRGLGG